ncbi:hypothetical protein [Clostridium beijerinckii]|uniref:Uncharacterized protein n=1 Tax=Clostridium beijerinckii TaxID=1520 RepID=A0A1S9N6J7_CLOBE|nr:hypothetical protein [Clostridium beijerinckii]OOP73187.1 hypothetical protein CBEIBR21_09125 [Clostridium beijerinckii]
MRKYFMEETVYALEQISKLYHFIWPSILALRNYKNKVDEYVKDNPEVSENMLNKLFAEDFEYNGIDFHKAIINKTWEEHLEDFAIVLLTNAFAIYEGWLSEICEVTEFNGYTNSYGKFIKYEKVFQFPSNGNNGIGRALNELNNTRCDAMIDSFYANTVNNKKYSLNKIENLLICYRFFKELRNSFIHNGGICDKKLFDSYNFYQRIANISLLGVKEVPNVNPVILNEPITLDIRGVVGLTDVIIRMIITIDAEISKSEFGLRYFMKKWIDGCEIGRTMKKDKEKRKIQFHRYIQRLGFPVTHDIDKLIGYFENSSLQFRPITV